MRRVEELQNQEQLREEFEVQHLKFELKQKKNNTQYYE